MSDQDVLQFRDQNHAELIQLFHSNVQISTYHTILNTRTTSNVAFDLHTPDSVTVLMEVSPFHLDPIAIQVHCQAYISQNRCSI